MQPNINKEKKDLLDSNAKNAININSLLNNLFIKNLYNLIEYSLNSIMIGFKIFINISGMYILWIILHYVASHLYIKFCVPGNFMGFLLSPFMTSTPHCQGLRWIVYNAANIINNMWVMIGVWICSTILTIHHEKKE